MEINILKERDTPLLSRKRVTLEITFEGATPSREKIREVVAAKLKSDKDLTVIKHIYTRYGVEKCKVIAHIYSNKEDIRKYEEKGVLKKHEAKKEEKAEKKEEASEKSDEASEEEKPAEEQKEKKE